MILRLLLTLFVVFSLSGCKNSGQVVKGSGKIVKEERKVEPFRKVVVSGVGSVLLEPDEKSTIVVEADDNLQEFIRTQVSEGVLYIETLNNVSLSPSKELVYHVTVNNPYGLEVSGAAQVKSQKQIPADELKIVLSGAGAINLDVDTSLLTVLLSGSGNLVLSGKAERQIVDVSGAGTYKGFSLESNDAQVAVSGVGNAEVNAKDSLDVDISGVGSVNYKGAPKLTQTISGVGAIRHVE